MIRPEFILNLNDELIVDNFAGGGGASTGIELALGRHVDHAINHDKFALGMHRINHPQTIHHCEDVFDVDPIKLVEGRRVGFGWFSPDCKHFSKAKGGKPLSKKIRGLAFVILRWAKIRTRVVVMENVEEIQTWGPLLHHPKHRANCACGKPCGKADPAHKGRTWQAFKAALGPGVDPNHPDIPEMLQVLGDSITKAELVSGFGYDVETREIRASDHRTPTIRKRLFMIARCDGLPIVWPEQTTADPKSRKADSTGRKLKPWRIVAECIDWNIPVKSIFLSKAEARKQRCRRPLAKSTLKRIAAGIDRYVLRAEEPFLVSLTHQGDDRIQPLSEPIRTITGAHRGEKAVVDATVAPFVTEHANASFQRSFPPDEPLRTQCAQVKGGHFSLVSAALAHTAHGEQTKSGKKRGKGQHPVTEPLPSVLATQDCALISGTLVQTGYGERDGQKPRVPGLGKPLGTVVSGGGKHAVVAASLCREFGESVGQPVSKPAPTVMPAGQGKSSLISASLVVNTTGHPGAPADKPAPTIPTGGHHALVAASLTKFTTGSVWADMKSPAPTIVAGSHSPDTHGGAASTLGLVAANMVKLRGDPETHAPGHPAGEPAHTVSAGGTHQALATAYLAQHNGGFNTTPGHDARDPLSTVSAKGSQQQVVAANLAAYYGNDSDGQGIDTPCRTVTTRERFGFSLSEAVAPPMTPEQLEGARRVAKFLRDHGVEFEGEFATVGGFVIVDIGMRMLTARELFRAQGFPEKYVIDRAWVIDPKTGEITEIHLTKEQQIRMCGNSVCPPVAEAITAANVPELAVWARGERKRFQKTLAGACQP